MGGQNWGWLAPPLLSLFFFFNFFYIVSHVNQRLTRGEPLIFEQKM